MSIVQEGTQTKASRAEDMRLSKTPSLPSTLIYYVSREAVVQPGKGPALFG